MRTERERERERSAHYLQREWQTKVKKRVERGKEWRERGKGDKERERGERG